MKRADPAYMREYQRKRRTANKKLLRAIKQQPCADCGVQYPYYVMDFDHLRDKKYVLGWSKNLAKSTLLAEVAKCEVVCSNCHRERTHRRKTKNK